MIWSICELLKITNQSLMYEYKKKSVLQGVKTDDMRFRSWNLSDYKAGVNWLITGWFRGVSKYTIGEQQINNNICKNIHGDLYTLLIFKFICIGVTWVMTGVGGFCSWKIDFLTAIICQWQMVVLESLANKSFNSNYTWPNSRMFVRSFIG